jgi:hypothetical protein
MSNYQPRESQHRNRDSVRENNPHDLCATNPLRQIGLTSTNRAELSLLGDHSKVSHPFCEDNKESRSGDEPQRSKK